MIEKISYLLRDNSFLIFDIFLIFGIFFYYYYNWKKYGKDPEKGVFFPRYEPPKGFEPEDVRYLKKMKFDNKCFSTFLVKLAIKGALKIEKEGKKFFLNKTDKDEKLTMEEKSALLSLFTGEGDKLEIDQENYQKFQNSQKEILKKLKRRFGNVYFNLNSARTGLGCFFSVLLGFFFWYQFVTYRVFGLFFFLIILNTIFWKIMPARSLMGRKIMDHIEGFKMFLKVADEDILKNTILMEKPLPFMKNISPMLLRKFLFFCFVFFIKPSWFFFWFRWKRWVVK